MNIITSLSRTVSVVAFTLISGIAQAASIPPGATILTPVWSQPSSAGGPDDFGYLYYDVKIIENRYALGGNDPSWRWKRLYFSYEIQYEEDFYGTPTEEDCDYYPFLCQPIPDSRNFRLTGDIGFKVDGVRVAHEQLSQTVSVNRSGGTTFTWSFLFPYESLLQSSADDLTLDASFQASTTFYNLDFHWSSLDITAAIAPIPVPAGMPLLLGGLGLFPLMRLRRRKPL